MWYKNYINFPFTSAVKRVFYSVIHTKSSFLKSIRLAQFTVSSMWWHILGIISLWSFKYVNSLRPCSLKDLKNLPPTKLSGISFSSLWQKKKSYWATWFLRSKRWHAMAIYKCHWAITLFLEYLKYLSLWIP